jgi:hypothetical protein
LNDSSMLHGEHAADALLHEAAGSGIVERMH